MARGMLIAKVLFMLEKLIVKIREYGIDHPDRSLISSRLLEMIEMITRSFTGEERERMLVVVQETFDNLVEIGRNSERARAALKRLQDDQRRLAGLVSFAMMKPATDLIH